MQTLQSIGILGYNATATAGDGRKVVIPIDITEQIYDLIGFHLAKPIGES